MTCTVYGYTAFYPGGSANPRPLGNQDPTQYTDNWDTYTKLTNEIRLTSPTDQRFRWLVGAYAQHQTDNIRVRIPGGRSAPALSRSTGRAMSCTSQRRTEPTATRPFSVT